MTKLTTPMLATLTTLALTSGVALAGSEDVVVDDAWARASIGVNRPGAAYMTIRNNGDEAVTLTGISTPLAMMPEIHESKTNAEGVSSMAPAGEITIAPGEAAELAPGGLHMMFMELKQPLLAGDQIKVKLTFEKAGEVELPMTVLARDAVDAMQDGKHGDKKHAGH